MFTFVFILIQLSDPSISDVRPKTDTKTRTKSSSVDTNTRNCSSEVVGKTTFLLFLIVDSLITCLRSHCECLLDRSTNETVLSTENSVSVGLAETGRLSFFQYKDAWTKREMFDQHTANKMAVCTYFFSV